MRTKLAPLALALAAVAITLTAVAAAGSVAAKQRIAIQRTAGSDAVALVPLTSGALGRDSGTVPPPVAGASASSFATARASRSTTPC